MFKFSVHVGLEGAGNVIDSLGEGDVVFFPET